MIIFYLRYELIALTPPPITEIILPSVLPMVFSDTIK